MDSARDGVKLDDGRPAFDNTQGGALAGPTLQELAQWRAEQAARRVMACEAAINEALRQANCRLTCEHQHDGEKVAVRYRVVAK